MKIKIWSDFACPYCYIGDNRLKKAIDELNLENKVEITYKTFQLDPNAVRREPTDYSQLLADKYNKPYIEAKTQVEDMITSGRELGLNFDFDRVIRTNTTLAHKVAKAVRDTGAEEKIISRFFKAYFEEGKDISSEETLLKLVEEIGLDIGEIEDKLSETDYLVEIQKDYKEAGSLGVSGVPFFVIDRKYGISGAQSPEYFKRTLEEVQKNF